MQCIHLLCFKENSLIDKQYLPVVDIVCFNLLYDAEVICNICVCRAPVSSVAWYRQSSANNSIDGYDDDSESGRNGDPFGLGPSGHD